MNNNIFEHLSDNDSSDHLSDNGSTLDMDVSTNPGDTITGDSYNSRYSERRNYYRQSLNQATLQFLTESVGLDFSHLFNLPTGTSLKRSCPDNTEMMEIAEVQPTPPEPPAFRALWEIAAHIDESRPMVPSSEELAKVHFPKGTEGLLAGIVTKISEDPHRSRIESPSLMQPFSRMLMDWECRIRPIRAINDPMLAIMKQYINQCGCVATDRAKQCDIKEKTYAHTPEALASLGVPTNRYAYVRTSINELYDSKQKACTDEITKYLSYARATIQKFKSGVIPISTYTDMNKALISFKQRLDAYPSFPTTKQAALKAVEVHPVQDMHAPTPPAQTAHNTLTTMAPAVSGDSLATGKPKYKLNLTPVVRSLPEAADPVDASWAARAAWHQAPAQQDIHPDPVGERHVPTSSECTLNQTHYDLLRGQTAKWHSDSPVSDRDKPTIADAAYCDSRIQRARYGILHRIHWPSGPEPEEELIDLLHYCLAQAGMPTLSPNTQRTANDLVLDEDHFRSHWRALRYCRDNERTGVLSDGLAFRLESDVFCGATHVKGNDHNQSIYSTVQRLYGKTRPGGKPLVHILQLLPHPVSLETVLNAHKYPDLGVVTGLPLGYENNAIAAAGLYAVQHYLNNLGVPDMAVTLVLGTLWHDDRTKPKTVKTKDNGKGRKQHAYERFPECIVHVVFNDTPPYTHNGQTGADFINLQAEFFDLKGIEGPVDFVSLGFRLSVRRSVKTLLTRPWTSAAGMQATHVSTIYNISHNCNAADLLALLYLGSGTISPSNWRVLFDIASAIVIGPQRNWYNVEQPAYLVLVWAGRPRELSIRALDLLRAPTYTLTHEDGLLNGLVEFQRQAVLAGRPPPEMGGLSPFVYPELPDATTYTSILAAPNKNVQSKTSELAVASKVPPTPMPFTSDRSTESHGGRGGRRANPPIGIPLPNMTAHRFDRKPAAVAPYAATTPKTFITENQYVRIEQCIDLPGASPQTCPATGPDSTGTTLPRMTGNDCEPPRKRSVVAFATEAMPAQRTQTMDIVIPTKHDAPSTDITPAVQQREPGPGLGDLYAMMEQLFKQQQAQDHRTQMTTDSMSKHFSVQGRRLTLEASMRELSSEENTARREICDLQASLQNPATPEWYRTEQQRKLDGIMLRGIEFTQRRLTLDQQLQDLDFFSQDVVPLGRPG